MGGDREGRRRANDVRDNPVIALGHQLPTLDTGRAGLLKIALFRIFLSLFSLTEPVSRLLKLSRKSSRRFLEFWIEYLFILFYDMLYN